MGLTIVTPTIGRPSLAATAESVLSQLEAGDEWLVVADGDRDAAVAVWDAIADLHVPRRIGFAWKHDSASVYGNAQRQHALSLVRTSHVCFLDDDDVYEAGALDLFRRWIAEAPEAVHVGRAVWGPGHHAHGTVLWDEPEFAVGNVATCMVVFPYTADMPRWMAHNSKGVTSDFGWMREAAEGREIVWHGQIVATVRP